MAISIGKQGFRIPRAGTNFGESGETVEISPAGFEIEIFDTTQNILARTGDPVGTIAFATDTFNIMVLNTSGYDVWASSQHEILPSQLSMNFHTTATGGHPQFRFNPPSVSGINNLDLVMQGEQSAQTLSNSGACLIAFWVKPRNFDAAQTILGGNGINYIYIATDRRIFWNGGSVIPSIGSTTLLTAGQWTHVMLSINFKGAGFSSSSSSSMEIFINGVSESVVSTGSFTNGVVINSLGSLYGGHDPFRGKIDELAIWTQQAQTFGQSVFLGADQLYGNNSTPANIYNNGATHDLLELTSPPSHWWRFGDGPDDTGSVINDIAGGKHFYKFNGANSPTITSDTI